MIPYVEIIRADTQGYLKAFGIVEPKECWFELSYYDVGEFQIYAPATQKNLNALRKGYIVKIPNKRYAWIITSIQYSYTAESKTRMISAKGYELKWIIGKRIIQTPINLSTSLFTAIYSLIYNNCGGGASAERQFGHFNVEQNSQSIVIPETQATRGNLLEYVNALLKAYYCGSTVEIDQGGVNGYELTFKAYKGQERANTVRFSQSFDNLLSSTYFTNDEEVGSFALVVSKVEDVDYSQIYNKGEIGYNRSEIYVESNLSTKYEDEQGIERETTPTSNLYKGWQVEEGKKAISEHTEIVEVSGEIDLQNSMYAFDEDFFLGDVVKVQDEYFNFYFDARISKFTMKQDSQGYGEEIEYGN